LKIVQSNNNVGKYESFAFLIDMNRLFEEFIREYLKQSLKCHGYTVEPGSIYLDEKEKIHLIPDIVISKNGSPIFIVDTKYKTLDDKNDAVLPDISQVLDCCLAYKIKSAVLLYPMFKEEIHSEYLIRNTDKRIIVETIDLSVNRQMGFSENISKFRDVIMKKLLT
jgi:5-methylcytosine-specific restriction enzyme subunit McrC